MEIEEERLRREREVQLRRGNVIGRTGSRASRSGTLLGPKNRPKQQLPDEQESQYSGHSSSSALRKDNSIGKLNRFDQGRIGRVKRSTSNVNRDGGPVGVAGARREIRKKIPGSVTSSLNSSESENAQNGGNRSVYLHAACVADIPPNSDAIKKTPVAPMAPRALSAESRTDVSTVGTPAGSTSNLQKSKKISRSISLLAPWKPKPAQRQQYSEIHYNNSGIYTQRRGAAAKPPVPPARRPVNMHRDKKSASSSDLLRDDMTSPIPGGNPTYMEAERARTVPRNIPTKVSRSVSMPKDTRLAGWFKRKKR